MDIFLSHDWPSQIWEHGDKDTLLRIKPYFREDMMSGKLGNPPAMDLLMILKPRFWFSAHLHVKFAAVVQHQPSVATTSSSSLSLSTRFLALDKVIPGRGFMQFLTIPVNGISGEDFNNPCLRWDLDWLAVLSKTHQKLHANEARKLNDSFISWITTEVWFLLYCRLFIFV
jgi:lariat debranching enzyme